MTNTPEQNPHDVIGQYPADLYVPPLEGRRYLWTSRAFAIGLYASLLVNFVLALALYTAWNVKEVIPMMVRFDTEDRQIVRIEPFDRTMPGFQAMTEVLVKEYVTMREEIIANSEAMQTRYTTIVSRTTNDIVPQYDRTQRPLIVNYLQSGLTREVVVESVRLPAGGKFFQVDFKTIDRDNTGAIIANGENNWIAYVSVRYNPQTVEAKDRYMNPLGFTVMQYSRNPVTKNQAAR